MHLEKVIKIKRLFDFVVAFILLIVLSPFIVVTAIIVKVKMGSPVIFKQQRPGLHSKPFYIYKFRTMTDDRDEKGDLLPNAQRLTKTGKIIRKLSLDELPQLVNVLKGELSLVGPRPLRMEYLSLYTKEQARRHDVPPGMTGWAQVNGRNNVTWEERFELDIWYIDNQSFWLDVKILFLTASSVFKTEGVNPDNKQFIEKFKGSNGNDKR